MDANVSELFAKRQVLVKQLTYLLVAALVVVCGVFGFIAGLPLFLLGPAIALLGLIGARVARRWHSEPLEKAVLVWAFVLSVTHVTSTFFYAAPMVIVALGGPTITAFQLAGTRHGVAATLLAGIAGLVMLYMHVLNDMIPFGMPREVDQVLVKIMSATSLFSFLTVYLVVLVTSTANQEAFAAESAAAADTLSREVERQTGQLRTQHERIQETAGRVTQGTRGLRVRLGEQRDLVSETLASAEELSAQAKTLLSMASSLASDTEDIVSSTDEMSRSVESSADNALRLASGLEQFSATMRSMAGQVASVTLHVRSLNTKGHAATETAKSGSETISKALGAIRKVRDSNTELQTTAQVLDQRVRAIGEVSVTIEEIADQTNLLALNAAIEAARAGDAGRGFAVVADEIRKLAERTIQATVQINTTVKQVQDDTTSATSATENLVGETERLLSSAEQVERAFGDIVSEVGEIAQLVSAVAVAAEEQNTAAEGVSRSVAEMQAAAQATSDASSEQDRTTKRILAAITNIGATSRGVSTAADEQRRAVDRILEALAGMERLATENAAVAEGIDADMDNLVDRTHRKG